MDRLDSPVTQLKPYLKCVFGCIILHVVIAAPYGNEKDYDNAAILTMGMQDHHCLPLHLTASLMDWYKCDIDINTNTTGCCPFRHTRLVY